MPANTVLAQVPLRQGFNTFTYLGTTVAPICTYNAFLSAVVAGDPNGGSPDIYSPVNPAFANDFNFFTPNRTYVAFAKSNFDVNLGCVGTHELWIPAGDVYKNHKRSSIYSKRNYNKQGYDFKF